MVSRRLILTAALATTLVVVVGCSSGEGPVDPEPGPLPSSAEEAVEALIDQFAIPDFDAAALLAYPGHAALAALSEGASFADVAEALREGDAPVAANFWSGFAQGAGDYLTAAVSVSEGTPRTESGVEFGVAEVFSPDVGQRVILTQGSENHRVDLFASFGAALAGPMAPSVERLLTTPTDDAALILRELKTVVPSLLVNSQHEWLSPAEVIDVLRLVELITRAG